MFRITIRYRNGEVDEFTADRLPEFERNEPVDDWLLEIVKANALTFRRGPMMVDADQIVSIFQERIKNEPVEDHQA